MAPTLWYTIFSPPVRCVLMTAKEIGLELELKPLDLMKGEQFSEEFKKINPQHTVPTLVDGDFVLWDSHAIATFLINKYAKDDSLYPTDIYKRAKIDQRLHYESSILFAVGRNIVEKIAYQGAKKVPDDLKIKLLNAYDFAEAFLEEGQYICGDTLTVADFSIMAALSSLIDTVPMDEEKHYKLIVYLERMKKLPYYDEVNHKGVVVISSMLKTKMNENCTKDVKEVEEQIEESKEKATKASDVEKEEKEDLTEENMGDEKSGDSEKI